MPGQHIYPVFEQALKRADKEAFLKQHAFVVWMTGLSGSGKSTIATGLEKKLFEKGFFCQLLDGDNVRTGINNNLGFSEADRKENIRRIAEVARLFLDSGIICICCFVSPTKEIRQLVKQIVSEENFIEVFINTPLEVCEKRDVKGLYKKARAGEIKDFTGISAPFEAPESPSLEIRTEGKSIESCVDELYTYLLPKITYKK